MRVLILFILIFLLRFIVSFTTFNMDVVNHEVWMDSAQEEGWLGLYFRNQSPWAAVNYPPLTLYAFYIGDRLHSLVPAHFDSPQVEAVFYKLPSLLADLIIGLLIWFLAPFSRRWRLTLSLIFLFNPALFYNSVLWGQVESWALLWCVLTGFFLVRGRGELAIVTFVIALLSKQNAVPLAPLVTLSLMLTPPPVGKFLAALTFSLGLIFLAYLPTLGSQTTIPNITQNYLASLAGQAHQHLSSVNALNLWYALGFNQTPDSNLLFGLPIRSFSLAFTALITLFALWYYHQHRGKKYQAFFTAGAMIYLGVFAFTTRMHERHFYMAVAFATFILPYFKNYLWYTLVTLLAFYNQFIVWSEFMVTPPTRVIIWEFWTRGLAVATSLLALLFPPAISRLAKHKT